MSDESGSWASQGAGRDFSARSLIVSRVAFCGQGFVGEVKIASIVKTIKKRWVIEKMNGRANLEA